MPLDESDRSVVLGHKPARSIEILFHEQMISASLMKDRRRLMAQAAGAKPITAGRTTAPQKPSVNTGQKKAKKKQSNLGNVLFILIFIGGLGVFLYPSVSDYINSKNQSRAISNYDETLANLSEADYSALWDAAYDYNQKLVANGTRFQMTEEELEEYRKVLNPAGTGIMGSIEIDKIDVSLPIYHETTEEVLAVGVGHLEGSSLPTGTKNTHCVLSGHRGLPSAKLFSDLDRIEVGDTFLLHILDQTFAYQVDQINIVLPADTGHLGIEPGEEFVTLVTCTPYGINTHRMMVRGRRVDYSEEIRLVVPADAMKYGPLVVAPFIGGPIIVILLVIYLIMPARRRTTAKRMARNMIQESRDKVKK